MGSTNWLPILTTAKQLATIAAGLIPGIPDVSKAIALGEKVAEAVKAVADEAKVDGADPVAVGEVHSAHEALIARTTAKAEATASRLEGGA